MAKKLTIKTASGTITVVVPSKQDVSEQIKEAVIDAFIDVDYNPNTGVLTFEQQGGGSKSIDLPLELIVESGYYDSETQELVLVLANGQEIRIPVDNLLTDLDAHNIKFNGSGTNYLVNKQDVESAVKELDTQVKGANDDIALRVKTSDIVDNLTSTDTDKPLSANQGKVLNDTKENLSNKKSVINDSETEYPNSKAVRNVGLDTPIDDFNGMTLKDVFEQGNLVNFNAWSVPSGGLVVNGKEIIRTIPSISTITYYRITNASDIIEERTYYLNYEAKYEANIDMFNMVKLNNWWGFIAPTQEYQTLSECFVSSTTNILHFDFYNTATSASEVKLYLRNVIFIDLTTLGLSDVSRETMDFWYNIYKSIVEKNTTNIGLNKTNVLNEYFEEKTNYFITENINGLFKHLDRPYTSYTSNYLDIKHTDIYDMYDELVNSFPTYVSMNVIDKVETDLGELEIREYKFKPVQPDGFTGKIPKVVMVTGQHGSEKMAILSAFNMFYDIATNWKQSDLLRYLRFNVEFVIIPCVNAWGVDSNTRTNHNGVDLNRNYPTYWLYQGVGTGTYSGPKALSEVESQCVQTVIEENNDAILFIDFHNYFGSTNDPYDSIWVSTPSKKALTIGGNFIRTMTSHFQKESEDVVQDDITLGYVSGGEYAKGGFLEVYAQSLGILSYTLEVAWKFHAIPTASVYDVISQKYNEEIITNFILQNLRILLK